MITTTIEFILTPIIWAMSQFLTLFFSLTGSPGASIVLLASLVALVTMPIGTWARRVEARTNRRRILIEKHVAKVTADLTGEDRFRATESVYEAHAYHPIETLGSSLSLLVILPFLISSMFLLSNSAILENVPFLFIPDLSQQDGLLNGFNALPFLMSGITIVDAWVRFSTDRTTFFKFCFIAALMFILVYGFPAALVLYWTTSNFLSLLMSLARPVPDQHS